MKINHLIIIVLTVYNSSYSATVTKRYSPISGYIDNTIEYIVICILVR